MFIFDELIETKIGALLSKNSSIIRKLYDYVLIDLIFYNINHKYVGERNKKSYCHIKSKLVEYLFQDRRRIQIGRRCII